MPSLASWKFVSLAVVLAIVATSSGEELQHFSGKDFLQALGNTHDFLAVLVTAPGAQCGERCAKAEGVFEKVAEKSGDLIRLGVVNIFETLPALGDDGDDSSVREYYNITAVPAILLFNVGYKDPSTRIIVDAQTAGFLLQSPKTLYTQASNFLPSLTKRVTQYSLGNFFTDEEPSLPRVLLFTEKKDTPLLLKKLSLELHRAAVIGEAPSSDKTLAKKFGVTSFPTLLVSPGGAQDPKAESFEWKRFNGDISYKALKDFLTSSVPAVTAKALRDQAAFESECASKGGVCFIGVLPPESKCPTCHATMNELVQDSYLKIESDGGRGMSAVGLPLKFAWTDGDFQTGFVSSFDRLQTPGLVALNAKKKMYSTFVGSFSRAELSKFVHNVMSGKEALESLRSLPTLETQKIAPVKKTSSGEGGKKQKAKESAKSAKKAKKQPKEEL